MPNSECDHIGEFPSDLSEDDSKNINVLELWPILIGLRRWAVLLRDKSIMVFTDNTQVLHMLLNGKSVNKKCMSWIREIFWVCVTYNIDIVPRYINTHCNLVADTLSRLLYFNSNKDLENNLNGSSLCCLSLLFDLCRSNHGRAGRDVV